LCRIVVLHTRLEAPAKNVKPFSRRSQQPCYLSSSVIWCHVDDYYDFVRLHYTSCPCIVHEEYAHRITTTRPNARQARHGISSAGKFFFLSRQVKYDKIDKVLIITSHGLFVACTSCIAGRKQGPLINAIGTRGHLSPCSRLVASWTSSDRSIFSTKSANSVTQHHGTRNADGLVGAPMRTRARNGENATHDFAVLSTFLPSRPLRIFFLHTAS
jgi:hypothetical protein